MSRDETERYMNVQIESQYWKGLNGSLMSFLYPAIYTVTCRLNIRFFPYDRQNCTLTISSWTNSKSALDYYADAEVNMASYITNEEWDVKSFKIYRHEYKYACCPEPWAILQASLVIQRKPLYYVVNLIIPTSIITVVSITGFFTPASTDDDRTEKINLGITTLLAMSILMLMVSDQMPTTSEFVPLIAWFYLAIIIIVSIGTFLTSVVLSVQCRRQYGRIPPLYIRYYFFAVIPSLIYLSVPQALENLWSELDDDPVNTWRRKRRPSHPAKTTCLFKEHANKSPLPQRRDAGFRQSTVLSRHAAFGRSNSIRMIDVSSPSSPAMSQRSGSPSTTQPQPRTLWEGTMSALTGTNVMLRTTSASYSREVEEMRRRRQCSLEWEFLAAVLDRFLLLIFITVVMLITMGLVVVGKLAQLSYDNPDEPFL
uniref:Acetylcholine receptor subunit alpha-type acr-16 n=1 Tax=Angiostrongylus cantonensis TaxID=6313 RepID=A0A158P9H4_ANGCA